LPDVPVRPSTLFYTGSTTKSFTAAAASLLVDDEKYPSIKWTTPLSQIIRDDFVLPDEYATAHVTLEDALSNRSGMSGHELTLGRPGTVRDVVRNLRYLKINKEIRTTWQYCNALFIAVGHMIEVITGEWLGDFLRKRIWEPLDMKSTFFSLEDAQQYAACSDNDATVAIPYAWDEVTSQTKEIPYFNGVLGGAGAVISSVLDYAKYMRSMMRQSGPLSKAGYDAMLQPRSFCPQMLPQLKKQMLYTLGWMSTTYHGEFVMLHPGGLEGMTATMIYFPERDWGVLVFCNADGPGRETLAWHLIDEMLNVPQIERMDLYKV
jgi:CubicO group peptidase (beta-lactamase class C family)